MVAGESRMKGDFFCKALSEEPHSCEPPPFRGECTFWTKGPPPHFCCSTFKANQPQSSVPIGAPATVGDKRVIQPWGSDQDRVGRVVCTRRQMPHRK